LFRLAKGYTQQEIAARLGASEEITPRFDSAETAPIKAGVCGSFRTGLGCRRLFRCYAVLYLRFGGAGRAVDGGMRLLRSLHPSADAQLCQISAQCPCGCRGAYCSSVCCGASVDVPKGGLPPVPASLISLTVFSACLVLGYWRRPFPLVRRHSAIPMAGSCIPVFKEAMVCTALMPSR